ncbi:MAG: hypothetical protein RL141_531, partial [Candidatus Parcubacteria bacterium]
IVHHVQKAHHLTQQELSILLAAGEITPSMTRRLAVIDLAQILLRSEASSPLLQNTHAYINKQREGRRFLQMYPHIPVATLVEQIKFYVTHPDLLVQEKEALTHLPRRHTENVRTLLRAHGMRINPLAFFATLTRWHDERTEVDQSVHFQMERLLRVAAERFHLTFQGASYLLPPELHYIQNGLVTERTLQHRSTEGMLIALEHGAYNTHEGERAVSMQDDLASRYMSQLAYEDVS